LAEELAQLHNRKKGRGGDLGEWEIKLLTSFLRAFTPTFLILATKLNSSYLCIMLKAFNTILSFLLSLPVLFYRYSISPFLRPSCRHVPTCSQYMLDALKIHGPFIGLMLGTGRILRCRPGGTHGYDPVPLFRFRRYRPLSELFKVGEGKTG
jgi:putative membrane protein insertion efficiency factor